MKSLGITLTILSALAITFLLFNNVFQAFEFFIKYGVVSMILLFVCLITSIIYAIIENIDWRGW